MDWWRAKLILIAAFACIDGVLAWQIARLRLPQTTGAPSMTHASVTNATVPPPPLPLLDVAYTTWSDYHARFSRVEDCTQNPDQPAKALYISCTACLEATCGTAQWYSPGVFVYQQPGATSPAEVQTVIKRLFPGASITVQTADSVTNTSTFTVTETYAYRGGGAPLFNVSPQQVTVTAGPQGLVAKGLWLKVLGAVEPTEAIKSAAEAQAAAADVWGPNVQVLPTVGYYRQGPWPSSAHWYVAPAYQVRVDLSDCVYVNAIAGAPQTLVGTAGTVLPC